MKSLDLVISQIRRVIFDNFNNIDTRFNNDQILELLKKDEKFDQAVTIDDLESHFSKIENDGLVRCIAQNFTTKWFKLYDKMEKSNCDSCNSDIFLGNGEPKICYNSECGAKL